MKKMLTLRNVLTFGGALLALIGFFVAFGAKLGNENSELVNIIMGEVKRGKVGGPYTSLNAPLNSVTSMAGVIMMIVAAVLVVAVVLLIKAKWVKWVVLGLAIVMFVGGILVFFVLEGYAVAYVDYAIKIGTCPASKRSELITEVIDESREMGVKGNAAVIISAILGMLGGVAAGVGAFVKDKVLVK